MYEKLQERKESDMLSRMILNLTERCTSITSNSSASQPMDSDVQCFSCPEPMNSGMLASV